MSRSHSHTAVSQIRTCKHDCAMLRSSLCLAFYGFLRGGEFTTPRWGTFNPAIHATPVDISLSTINLQFHIKQSKTDQHALGHTVSLGATGGKQCPVCIIQHYLTHYSTGPQQPLFIRCNGIPILHTTNGRPRFYYRPPGSAQYQLSMNMWLVELICIHTH